MPRIGHSEIVLYLSIKLIIEAEDMKIIRAKVNVPIQNHKGDPVFLVFSFIMFANLFGFQAGSQFPITYSGYTKSSHKAGFGRRLKAVAV